MPFKLRILPVLILSAALTGTASAETTVQAREQAAMQATQQLVKELGGALKKELKTSGPEGAIKVCKELAPAINARISSQHGWRVTRVSDRYRNAMLGMPDAWEATVLKKFAERKASGEPLGKMKYSEVVTENGKQYFRFMKAIGLKPMCTTCHGQSNEIPGGVKAKLEEWYPYDRATGYSVGDLRGAVSIKEPLDTP